MMQQTTDPRPTLVYLGLPAFLFLSGFIRPGIAIPLGLALAIALSLELRRSNSITNWSNWPVFLSLAVVVLACAGFPHGPFPWDWFKHWALLDVLTNGDWPTHIEIGGETQYLRFYTGAYLPTAFANKLLKLPAWIGFSLWIGFGYALLFRLVAGPESNSKRLTLISCLLFLTISGADAWIMYLLRATQNLPTTGLLGIHSEWWLYTNFGIPVQYSSMLTSLIWVPHQSIATFLVAHMLMHCKNESDLTSTLLAYGFLALWSPFGMIGLLPIVLFRACSLKGKIVSPRLISTALISAAYALLIAAYLSGGLAESSVCFSCAFQRIRDHALPYLTFYYVELGFFLIILWRKLLSLPDCAISLGILITLPLIAGATPDLVMRAALGPLAILSLRCVETITTDRPRIAALVAGFFLILPTGIGELVYQSQQGRLHAEIAKTSPRDPLANPWYYSFAPSSHISITDYLGLVSTDIRDQYFTNQPHKVLDIATDSETNIPGSKLPGDEY